MNSQKHKIFSKDFFGRNYDFINAPCLFYFQEEMAETDYEKTFWTACEAWVASEYFFFEGLKTKNTVSVETHVWDQNNSCDFKKRVSANLFNLKKTSLLDNDRICSTKNYSMTNV
ncbi:hypothetical protein CAEBREN_29049 [Caenorhabditis brenneri]|uniref:Uncharacterized protein n=1 Tax=Caenorhabditis brenneri TaxID=135651 RepID=G0N6A9_CAEBE|nr:hypothetical protein CAEBREN_29049 [Caenorhabditis brenneri]